MKHYSKNYIGLKKTSERQDLKEDFKHIQITPIVMTYGKDGYEPLCKCVFNNKWRGTNLYNLLRREDNLNYPHNTIDSKIKIINGKYYLTSKGRLCLKRKKDNK